MVIEREEDGRARRQPAYLRIAAQLRADIASGRIGPGRKLPSETQLMMRHGVSRSVAKWAISVLKADGLVDGRQGAGIFVRSPHRITRESHWPGLPAPGDATQPLWPPAQPGTPTWQLDPWTYQSEQIPADAATARRLAIEPGTPVLRISNRYATPPHRALVTSWQPATTPPADPDQAVRRADQQYERVIVRPATPDEITGLALPARGSVLMITRTFTLRDVPIETADIVLPSDQYELIYRLPVE